jgi:hypothetical protein
MTAAHIGNRRRSLPRRCGDQRRPEFRRVYQPYILAMKVIALVCLRWQVPPRVPAVPDPASVPFALLGAIAGFALFQRMNNRQFHVATSALLLASGVGLLARAL